MTNFTLRTLDIPALHRHAIGFDQLFQQLERTFANSRGSDNYPPHNVIKLNDTHFVIEVAVAGFKQDEIDVELADGVLIVKGEQAKFKDDNPPEYLHRGISARNFTRSFNLAENIQVESATVENGILAVGLELIVPEEQKPKKIAITFKK